MIAPIDKHVWVVVMLTNEQQQLEPYCLLVHGSKYHPCIGKQPNLLTQTRLMTKKLEKGVVHPLLDEVYTAKHQLLGRVNMIWMVLLWLGEASSFYQARIDQEMAKGRHLNNVGTHICKVSVHSVLSLMYVSVLYFLVAKEILCCSLAVSRYQCQV